MKLYDKYQKATAQYLASLKIMTRSKATYEKYNFVLNDFGEYLKAHDDEQAEISPLFIVEWRNKIKDNRNLGNNSLRHYLTILHTFFSWAITHNYYTEQPILKNDIPKRERIEYDLLTEKEINRILSGEIPPYTSHPLRMKAIIFTFLLTGLRVSELINLRVGDLDLQNGTVTVIGKGDKLRTSTLPKPLIVVLQEYLRTYNKIDKSAELVFNSTDKDGREKPFTRQNITGIVEGYVNRLLGHKHIGAHDLRHCFASMLITNGCALEDIQNLLGHSNYATTAIYAAHLRPNSIAEQANTIFDTMSVFANL